MVLFATRANHDFRRWINEMKCRLLAMLLCLPFLAGCGTFVARTGWRQECSGIPRYYPATSVDDGFYFGPIQLEMGEQDLPITSGHRLPWLG